MKKLIPLLIIASFLFSCTKDIKFNNEDQEQKDVVNCVLSADSTMELVLYKSNLPLSSSNKFTLIKDAQVEISESNNSATLVFSGGDFIENGIIQGSYKSNQIVKDKTTYQLSIKGNNNKDLSSEIYVPRSPEIITPEIVFTPDETELRFTINDPIDEENYYSIELNYNSTSYDTDGIDTIYYETYPTNAYLYSKKDNSGFITFEDDLSGEKVLFSDDLFIGGNNKIKLYTYINPSEVYEYYGMFNGTIYSDAFITISSINKSLFDYEQSIQEQLYSEGDIFSEPVQIQSNIKNGIGILGSKNSKTFEVEF